MWELQRLHMVDCALGETSSSVLHLKHVTWRPPLRAIGALAAGLPASSTRKCCLQLLQTVEYAAGGSSCVCPQWGHVTGSLLDFGVAGFFGAPATAFLGTSGLRRLLLSAVHCCRALPLFAGAAWRTEPLCWDSLRSGRQRSHLPRWRAWTRECRQTALLWT